VSLLFGSLPWQSFSQLGGACMMRR
jgi:hypothetical protein